MKILSFIFSLYLLTLACYPCSDRDSCADEQRMGMEINVGDHQHNEAEADHCSPLCICSCCAATVQLTEAGVIIPLHVEHNTYPVTLYIQQALRNNAKPIWQPPKVS